jgi:DNA-binding NarL/FixJ family response regulator
MRRLRIVLADEQAQVLRFIQMFPEPNYHVVGAVRDGQDLVNAARVLRPDLVVMDIDMPRLNGVGAVRQLRKILPNCRVIIKSSHGEFGSMVAAYAAGASAYLVIGGSSSLRAAIQAVIDHPGRPREWDTVLSNDSC